MQLGSRAGMVRTVKFVSLALLCAGGASSCSTRKVDQLSAGASDWLGYGRDEGEQRFSPLTQIDASNVGRLGLAWSLDLPGENALPSTPLAVDGVLYFSGSFGTVYAVDAVAGRELWKYDPHANEVSPRGARKIYGNNRGVAYWDGKVYVATKDGRMIALDAKSGKPVWTSQFLIEGDRSTSSGAPRVFDGKVIIGNSGAELGARGYVTTLDAKTGKFLWRFFTVPGNPAVDTDETTRLAAKTWSGEWWKYGGGGTPWNAMTYDAQFHQVLIGTGNGGPWNPRFRCETKSGKITDNLFVASVVALDANTGKYKWHYQYNPCEASDWKATMDIILADLTIDGKPRKVMMQAPSNGFFYVIDRTNGKLISAEKIGKVNWADRIDLQTGRPVERPGIRYEKSPSILYPSILGAHNWQAMSYNPKTGLVYIPYMQLGVKMSPSAAAEADVKADPSKLIIRLGALPEPFADPKDPLDNTGSLLAWNPITQKLQWRVNYPSLWNAGTMTSAGNLVFQGTNTGKFFAYDASTGKRLWSFDAKLGILAPPITYSAKGRQYVSLLVGYGAGAGEGGVAGLKQGWKYGLQPRRLLTFALDGKAKLPETPPADFTINPLDDPKITLDPKAVQLGMAVFHRGCNACHGATAVATGGAPDLRESGIAFDRKAFGQLLHDGTLLSNGMPRFDDLSSQEVDQIYQYIRSEARAYKAGRAPDQLAGEAMNKRP
ncbi:PQQ-dependent methanol/ethanol family dehydrogenase [Sphingomonas oligophenolica]|uniref:PQQ-dependent dehydrogenase, methanol/ethanol family n=1 Tax=Sphingomonas oligophenolica TaxID=301154 RepID=A0ABU9YB05_9SPHN